MQQFGTITALTILFSFLSSVWVLPSILVIWAKNSNLSEGLHGNEKQVPEAKEKSENSSIAVTEDSSEENDDNSKNKETEENSEDSTEEDKENENSIVEETEKK